MGMKMIDKKDWKRVKLGDVCDRASSNIAQNKITKNEGLYPIFGASGLIKYVDFFHRDEEYIGLIKDGSGVGRANIFPAQSSVIGTLQYILPKENIYIKYLLYTLQGLKLEQYVTGIAIPHIYFKDYSKELIYLPPLPTQHQIVRELDCLSTLLKKQKQQLAELDTLAQAIFYDMFGDPVTNEKGWEKSLLNKIGSISRGLSKHRPRNSPALLGGPYPLIQTGEVSNSGLYIMSFTQSYSELGLKQSKLWEMGTLCITIAANIAKTAILSFPACFPDSIVGFIPSNKTNAIFIHFWFGFFQQLLESQAPESAQKNINLKILSELEVIVPPLPLQQLFASKIEAIELQKEKIQASIKDTQQLFDYTMDKYFN